MVLFPTLHVGRPLGIASEAALEGLGLPLGGPGLEVVQLLGSQGFWQHQVLRGVGGWGSRKYSALEGYGWGSLAGCRLWGRTESDTTEAT